VGDDDASAATLVGATTGAPAIGQRFAGRYLVERMLGRGGMGTVWAVLDAQLGERVALKMLHPDTRDAGAAIERFRREVRLARRITHPNVARIYDIGDHQGVHYLTMEWIHGASLAEQLVAHTTWAPARALAMADQIARGLAAAHACGVVHRDLKPANVLVEESGRAAITDFGIACAITGDVKLTLDRNSWMGTPAYMSPEQVRGDPVDARSDVYALGTILFEMLTGRLPFVADGVFALALARIQQPACDPSTLVTLDEDLAALVRSCLAMNPDERPTSAAEVSDAIQRLGPDAGVGAPAAAPTPKPTFMPVRPGAHGIAVLPFRYRGPASDEYLADALTDELVDLLSNTRGLKVAARGATARFVDAPDPKTIGRELGVDAIIEGTVQRAGPLVRISARLLATETGFQTWSERFEGRLDDVFDMQDRMAKRVAESLRVELQRHASLGEVSEEAVALYLRARKRSRSPELGGTGEDNALALLDRAIQLAPHFKPALAAHAIMAERMWFFPGASQVLDWREIVRASVARALAEAPDLAETHVAAARYAAHTMDLSGAARSLSRALTIAPTSAAAHEYLGFLQCEAGRADEGIRHLELAAELDPTLTLGLLGAARHYELVGDHARADEYLQRVRASTGAEVGLIAMEARFATWRGDMDTIRRCREAIRMAPGVFAFFMLITDVFLGERDAAEIEAAPPASARGFSPRFATIGEQLTAEVLASAGRLEGAMAALRRAVDHVLVDLAWLERCPLLEPLRTQPDYSELHARVRARAEEIWAID
jgi:serine/threonine-protein kinase